MARQLPSKCQKKAGNKFLQFTASIWGANKDDSSISKKVSVHKSETFPYLDMELSWAPDGSLRFGVHLKPNQHLKYLNRGSSHTTSVFKVIPDGVLARLAKLTTVTEGNKDKKLDELYPQHAKALKIAALAPPSFPTLSEALKNQESTKEKKLDKAKADFQRSRSTFFCVGFSKHWPVPVHTKIKEIRSRFSTLSWIRVSMSYHKFPNLREIFQSDVSTKILRGVESLDFKDEPCNCNNSSKSNGKCVYEGNCRKKTLSTR